MRFYTGETLRSIRIPRFAITPTIYRFLLRSFKKENYLSCIEEKGSSKDIHCIAQNAALFVNLL